MIAKYSQARPARRPATIRFIAVLAVGLLLAGCGKEQPAETAATATPTTTAPAATPATAVSAKVTAMTADQLREAASKAYAENRLYAPAEDNAVEYYLALRDKSPGDAAAVASALGDLLPMTVIAIEQSVNRDDFSEANRLAALLEKADGKHPALARLKASIAAQQATAAQRVQQLSAEEEAKRLADLEKQRLADQKKQQEDAAKKLAAQEASQKQAADKATADKTAADRAAAERATADKAAADRRAAEQRTAAAAAAPAASDLRPISMPAPKFPPEALRAGTSGSVLVEYTVGTDGTVTAARVVRSNPSRIFDREAVNAVRKWRFQPVGSPVTTRREISFNPRG